MPSDTLRTIQTAIHGLLYTSETDSPFTLMHWRSSEPTLTSAVFLKLIDESPGAQVEEIGLEEFFRGLTQDQDWHDEVAKQFVQKYRNLLIVLKQNLAELKVFRIGKVQIDIYVVGREANGDWAGIKTTAVET
jgi:hypothetical protein